MRAQRRLCRVQYAGAAMRILYVVGTRPNFVKTAPVIGALRARLPEGRHAIVHTGQHYDRLMSEVFLEELGRAGARLHARGRLRQPRGADGADDGAPGAGPGRRERRTW